MSRLKRYQVREERPINREVYIEEWPETGLIILGSPNDPKPSLAIQDGRIVEMDGRSESDFDLIDRFITSHAINLDVAEEAIQTDSLELARMMIDINIPRSEVARLLSGCTPAKLVEITTHLNTVEMMVALQKMRIRRKPENQAHVTNLKDNPVLLAADAAEAALRGFAEEETTVGVARFAPLNALAVLVGSQTGRGGVLTQCSVEEALGLQIAMKGFTSYAETLSVYGTAKAFTDGDDTPWSKMFLASAYASRGVKIRFTSGSGSEALMGHAEGKSMLYLEARSLMVVKGAGSQGVQNGSISIIALPMSLPGGVWGVLAENLLAAMLGLEVASGNDALSSHSQIRKAAKLMLQFLPGTDFVTSGYSSIPKADNMFGGGNFDADDLDDWYVLQRDMIVDGGIHPVREEEVIAIRERATRALKVVFEELHFPPVTEEEVDSAVYAYDSHNMPERDNLKDIDAATQLLSRNLSMIDVIQALARRGFMDIASRILEMQRQRIMGDYLQPAAVFSETFEVCSAFNMPNDYQGPGTGYRVHQEHRWQDIKRLTSLKDPRLMVEESGEDTFLRMKGVAGKGNQVEVVIGIAPGFGDRLKKTISGLSHRKVLNALIEGIHSEGIPARVIKIFHTSDCAFLGHAAAQLSGSGVAIGIQSKGTTVIHQRDLSPLNNLELFSMAPDLTLETYRLIGENAARYALGREVSPITVRIDNTARLRLIVQTTILHLVETGEVSPNQSPIELELLEGDHVE